MLNKAKSHLKIFVNCKSLRLLFCDSFDIVKRRIDFLPEIKNVGARVRPIYDEDYDFQWGKIDYKGKTVLDLGADIGSTADFFLGKGLRKSWQWKGLWKTSERYKPMQAFWRG